MKSKILDIHGKLKESIELPICFSERIREDIVTKAVETKKTEQPFAPAWDAGRKYSARGLIVHRRHVWKSGYGRGMSRTPRKIMSKKGSQFHWVGASAPHTVGGGRAHPPKVLSRMYTSKLNKKELRIALFSAIGATGNAALISKKYETLRDKKIENVPFIVESKILSLKTKDFIASLKHILGNDLFELAVRNREIRKGKGKMRGRKYKVNAGLLLVVGNDEKIKTGVVEVENAGRLGVVQLAKGGLGRLTLYTEKAIKDLQNKFGGKSK